MNKEFTNIEEITRYTHGQMTEAEEEQFEIKLAADEDLANEVAAFQELMMGVDALEKEEAVNTIKEVEKKLEQENFFKSQKEKVILEPQEAKVVDIKTAEKSNFRFMLSIAASLAAIVAVGIYLFRPVAPQRDLAKATFAQYYHADTTQIKGVLDDLESMGMAAETNPKLDSLAQALNFYEAYEFDNARKALLDYVNLDPSNKMAQLYLGLSYIQLENYGKGVELLSPLANDESFEKNDMAKWYLALSQTQINPPEKRENAKKLLDSLCKANSSYQELACNYVKLFL